MTAPDIPEDIRAIADDISLTFAVYELESDAWEAIVRALLSERTRATEALQDKIDGLESDLDNAVETAFKRGAVEWTRLNYPDRYAVLAASIRTRGRNRER